MERLDELMQRIDKFNKDRDWDQFNTPVNLAKSISIEANELLECYQWNDDADIADVKEELAKLLEVSFATINRWENGHTEPTIKAKRKLFELCKENGIEVE